MQSLDYDPEEIILTKKDILNVLDSVEKIWAEDGRFKHTKWMIGLKAFRIGVKACDDHTIQQIFKWVLKAFDYIRFHNMTRGKTLEAKTLRKLGGELDHKSLAKEIFG